MSRRAQLLLLLLCPPVATVLSFALHANALTSILLFLGLPSIIASIGLSRRIISKVALFTLIVAPIGIVAIDYIAELNSTWLFFQSTIFSFRLLKLVTLEVIIWAVLNIYAVVAFYERFFERHRNPHIFEPRIRNLLFLVGSILALFLTAYFKTSGRILIPYFYAVFGTVLIGVPVLLYLSRRPALAGKFFLTGSYFFYLSLLYEITALHLGQWSFPGSEFIGWVSFAGVSFPLEEFVFWLMLTAMSVLAYYEYFDDDNR